MSATLTASANILLPGGPARHLLHIVYSPDRSAVGRIVELGRADLIVGREPKDGGLRIRDARMSREHARLRRSETHAMYQVEDLGAKNRLLVGGKITMSRVLLHGDVMRLGDSLLVYEQAQPDAAEPVEEHGFVGESAAARTVRVELKRASRSKDPVLLNGESGVGKEVAARALHRLSDRRGDLVALNCGAIPPNLVESTLFGHQRGAFTGATTDNEGYFVAAQRGTLFLDEIAELPGPAQAALLRVLDDKVVVPVGATRGRKVDASLIVATNVDLGAAVQEGRFRADLYARVAGWPIPVPPLRERRPDILALCTHLSEAPITFEADAAEALLIAPWPANVRELRTTIGRAQAIAGPGAAVRVFALPKPMTQPILTRATAAAAATGGFERPSADELVGAFRHLDGNVAQVAKHFGRTRKQIYRWLKYYDLELDTLRG